MNDIYKCVKISDTALGIRLKNYIKIIGTKVITGSGDYRLLFSSSDMLSMLKALNSEISSFDNIRCLISTNNGDSNAANIRFYEPEWWGGNSAYYQYFYPGISGPVRVNFCIEYIYL